MDANLYAEQSKVILTAQRLNDVREALAGAERNRGIPFGGQGCFELHKGAIVLADEVLALRAEIESLWGKVRELDRRLGAAVIRSDYPYDEGTTERVRNWLRELGLITEARDGE